MTQQYALGAHGRRPPDSCIACFKADTITVVLVDGDAEWLAAVGVQVVGMEMDEAIPWAIRIFDHQGVPHGGRALVNIRLCRACAGVYPVAAVADLELGGEFRCIRQPPEAA